MATTWNDYLSHYDAIKDSGFLDIVGRIFRSAPGPRCQVSLNTATSDTDPRDYTVIHLGSYNYSGLNHRPSIIRAMERALQKYGPSSSGVRLLNGTYDPHVELEGRLARFLGKDASITFSSGYAANVSVLSALCGPGDLVYSDQLNHRSIVAGLSLSGATIVTYKHNSMAHLRTKLNAHSNAARKFIVTDGVFSINGDLADLPGIVELAREHHAVTIVDDAHGLGAVGPNGKGTAAHFQLTGEIDVITGSLSKALPGIGGFAATTQRVKDGLTLGANSYVYSASMPPPVAAGLIEAINVLEQDHKIPRTLHANAERLRRGIQAMGMNTLRSCTPIIPVLMPSLLTMGHVVRELHHRGVYVNPIAYPAVSRKLMRLRLSASASFTANDIDFALRELETVFRRFDLTTPHAN